MNTRTVGLVCLIFCFIGICLASTAMGALDDANNTGRRLDGAINYDYNGLRSDHIGSNIAPEGMSYVTIAVAIDNMSDKAAPLGPSHYILICNDIAYQYDPSATSDKSVESTNGYVLPNGWEDTQIVYKVKGKPSKFTVMLVDFPNVPLNRINLSMPSLGIWSPNAYPLQK